MLRVATSLAFYRSQKGLSLKNSEKKFEKGFPGPLGPGVEKPQKESKMTIFQAFFSEFSAIFQLFFDFFWAGREAPGTPFRTFFGVF